MGELINGRMAEAIKDKILWCCSAMCCGECKYDADGDFCSSDTVLKDALALIERLESERDAALAKVPKWISVEEKMPPEDTEVLVYATEKIKGFGSVTAICEYSETTSMFGNKTGRFDWSSPWEYFHVDYKITHWMPQPEPPKEGE